MLFSVMPPPGPSLTEIWNLYCPRTIHFSYRRQASLRTLPLTLIVRDWKNNDAGCDSTGAARSGVGSVLNNACRHHEKCIVLVQWKIFEFCTWEEERHNGGDTANNHWRDGPVVSPSPTGFNPATPIFPPYHSYPFPYLFRVPAPKIQILHPHHPHPFDPRPTSVRLSKYFITFYIECTYTYAYVPVHIYLLKIDCMM